MKKQSKIKSLLVMPLIASAIFLASPAFAASPTRATNTIVRNITNKEHAPNNKKGIVGTVTSINGTSIIVTSKNNIQYTVDATNATIMKASDQPNVNPSIVQIASIKVGDAIVVRGVINNREINATDIFDGKMPAKRLKDKSIVKNLMGKKMHLLNNSATLPQ